MAGNASSSAAKSGHVDRSGVLSQSLSSVLNNPQIEAEDSVVSLLMHGEYGALFASPQKLFGMQQDQTWVQPTVTPHPDIPPVVMEDFTAYLSAMSALMNRFEAMHPAGRGLQGDEQDDKEDGGPGKGSWRGQAVEGMSEELKAVPALFFSANFRLEDQETFEKSGAAAELQWASGDPEDSDDGAGPLGGGGGRTPGALQEELSHYLDVVEQNLMRQVQARSDAFYAALDNLQQLYAEVDGTMETILAFRAVMKALDERLVGHALRIAQLRRQRKNVEELHRKLNLVTTVRQTQQNLQVLLSCSDFVSALDLIASAHAVLQTELKGVASLRDTEAQLLEMQGVVEKMMCSEFVQLSVGKGGLVEDSSGALGDLGAVLENSDPARSIAEDPASLVDVEDRLLALALALVRVGKLREVLQELKAAGEREVLSGIKAVLREEMPPAETGQNGEEKAPLAERLRVLEAEEFLALMKRQYKVLTVIVSRFANVHGLVCAVLKAQEEGGDDDEEDEQREGAAKLIVASEEVLDHICYTGHQRCARLIEVRKRRSTNLSLGEFSSLFDATVDFVAGTERLCGNRKEKVLRLTMVEQSKAFLDALHESNVSKLTTLLDAERWVQVDVPAQIQRLVHDCIRPGSGWKEEGGMRAVAAADDAGTEKQLELEGEKYYVVGVLTSVLKMLSDYVGCAVQLPTLGAGIVDRIFALVKVFRDRSCRLVLGAEAMTKAGLKTITAKHLALSAQAQLFLSRFLPLIKTTLSRVLPLRQQVLLGELDKLVGDLKEHEQELYNKLVSIMRERVDYHCRALAEEDWNTHAEAEEASGYMRSLIKELQNLVRVLAGTLDRQVVQQIIRQIAQMAAKRLVEHYSKLSFSTSVSQHRVAADATILAKTFHSLEGFKVDSADLQTLTTFAQNLPAIRDA